MPKFRLNKLVRDGFEEEYRKSDQKAVYIKLSPECHKARLVSKIVEEALEIKVESSAEEVTKEIADIEQAIEDLRDLYGVSEDSIKKAKQRRYEKMGGFKKGLFVDTLELKDDDKWVKYYRKEPDIFTEI